ncbi:helix-hairpin-helix domain-containing protein [Pedobacter sp. SYP-B3415]|uniref:helix-hairpin-helix domain-containing protein n=1 Tax=Pedobacter sp. SYP-B3415 TaxID=2496641 RepID=UPI00101B90B0|nr:helix-hairpin-helix domain-containing protein [Pedobacter sp. SYP-B3415]
MENKAISRSLRLLSQLMELHEHNPFKIKSVANAAFKADKLPFRLDAKSAEELAKIDGIGKSIAAKITELLQTGTMHETEELRAQTPAGVVEMLGMKGIGPKKIAIIWRILCIETVGELYYACNENRLIEAKGFGLKTQEEIKRAIEFKLAANGRFLYARAEPLAHDLSQALLSWAKSFDGNARIEIAGALRRRLEIIDELDFVMSTDHAGQAAACLSEFPDVPLVSVSETHFSGQTAEGLRVNLNLCYPADLALELFKQTGSAAHVEAVLAKVQAQAFDSEQSLYAAAGLAFVEPELREDAGYLDMAAANTLPGLITYEDLRGTLHNHSTWSDGVHSLEEMAVFCRDVLKLEYLGICDHSKTAVYAHGLYEERVAAQHREIDELNTRLDGFRIFKGIESDILGDGSLDFAEDVLKTFDFVVASVHSNLKMDEEKATARLIKAIENPYTTILGHPTGRLLLTRAGYPIDYKKVIDACAANGVVIEINSNPLRLDLDWRWHRYALEKGVLLSINPDAHRNEGFHDMRYGVLVARKGGLSKARCLNAYGLAEIESYFEHRRNRRNM